MSTSSRARLTWAIAIAFASISAGREALPSVPDSGQTAGVGNGFSYIGVAFSRSTQTDANSDDADDENSTDDACDLSSDSDSCPNFNDCFPLPSSIAAIVCVPAPSLWERVRAVCDPVLACCFAKVLQARAPPSI